MMAKFKRQAFEFELWAFNNLYVTFVQFGRQLLPFTLRPDPSHQMNSRLPWLRKACLLKPLVQQGSVKVKKLWRENARDMDVLHRRTVPRRKNVLITPYAAAGKVHLVSGSAICIHCLIREELPLRRMAHFRKR